VPAGFAGNAAIRHDRRGKNLKSASRSSRNGDIDSPEKAREVLSRTRPDAIMIGRAAQGRPWIFREIEHFLVSGGTPACA